VSVDGTPTARYAHDVADKVAARTYDAADNPTGDGAAAGDNCRDQRLRPGPATS